jgi:NAD+ diphosphatase
VPTDVTLPYNGLTLDRARRTDAEWLASALDKGRVLAFWQDSCLVNGERPVSLDGTGREGVLLGADQEGVFVVDLSDVDADAAVREAGADDAGRAAENCTSPASSRP